MPYDVTQVRAHLKRYMKEIRDILTTEKDLARYESFISKLKALSDLTDRFYSVSQPMTAEDRRLLRKSYEEAFQTAGEVLSDYEVGPVGLQLRSVVREITPLLLTDLNALEMAERDQALEGKSLPELIGGVRTEAVDLGNAPGPQGIEPMPIRVETQDDMESGVFVPAPLGLPNGEMIAYSRAAGLLGQPELITKARPMVLSHWDGSTAGTFVPRSEGIDPLRTGPVDPLFSFGEENLDTPAAVSGLASIQAMDFLFGVEGRRPEHCRLLFDPPYSGAQPARLVGLTAGTEGLVFGNGPADPRGLSVIPQSMVEQLRDPAFEEHLRFALRDCTLPEGTVERILERRSALLSKVEEDREFYEGKEAGFVEAGRLRVVPDNDWEAYHLGTLAQTAPDSPFAQLLTLPARMQDRARQQQAEGTAPAATVPVGRVIGSALKQERDPVRTEREETLKLHIPVLNRDSVMKGAMSQRYPIKWREGDKEVRGMFTLPKIHSGRLYLKDLLESKMEDPNNAPYKDVLRAMRDYYVSSTQFDHLTSFPFMPDAVPYEEMGLSSERRDELINDDNFSRLLRDISTLNRNQNTRIGMEDRIGATRGQRIDLRNVAMSEIGDVLGVPKLLARSVPAKVELDGRIVDGVFMEEAEGIDYMKAEPGTAMASITEEMAPEVFNTEGLKDLADMQILDYICLNQDRHRGNMFYRFEGLETGHPRFLGVQGIDNDLAFGTRVPADDEHINATFANLVDIRVISESMAKKLREGGLMDRVAEKMRKNGLRDEEIGAARKRFEKIKKHLDTGKMKIVPDGEWGKGDYTYDKLAGGEKDCSIFKQFKDEVVDVMTARAKEHPVQPGQFKSMKQNRFQEAERVEEFGKNVLDAAERERIEKEAAEEFARRTEEALESSVQVENPEHQALLELHESTVRMMQKLKEGRLPWPWGSQQYRDMYKAGEELLKMTTKLTGRIRGDSRQELSVDETRELTKHLDTMQRKSAAYTSYKNADLSRRAAGSSTASRRQAAEAGSGVAGMVENYRQKRRERQEPMKLVHEKLKEAQAGLSGKTGDALREQTARVLYLTGLTRMDLLKKSGMGVRRALKESVIARQTVGIKADPAFKRLTAAPDDELRAVAAGEGGRNLVDRYVREMAKQKQQEQSMNRGYQPQVQPKKEGPQLS